MYFYYFLGYMTMDGVKRTLLLPPEKPQPKPPKMGKPIFVCKKQLPAILGVYFKVLQKKNSFSSMFRAIKGYSFDSF